MAKRKFYMHEYRQIIVNLRLGESIRNIAQSGLASRKKIRAIQKVAKQQHWLDVTNELPNDDVLARFFKTALPTVST